MNLFLSPLNTCFMTRVFWTLNNEMIGEATPDLQWFIVETEDQFLPAISKEHNEIPKRKSKARSSCRSSLGYLLTPQTAKVPHFPVVTSGSLLYWAAPPSCHKRTTTGGLWAPYFQAHQWTLSPVCFGSEEQTRCLSEHVLFQVSAPNLKRTVQSCTVKRSWEPRCAHLATYTTAFVLGSVSRLPLLSLGSRGSSHSTHAAHPMHQPLCHLCNQHLENCL